MSRIGKAYLEVRADLKKFPADLRAKLKAAFAEGLQGVEFTGLDEKAKESGAKAADEAASAFEKRAKDRLRHAGEEGGRSLLGGLRRIFSGGSGEGRGFLGSVSNFFSSIVSGIRDAVSSGASGAGSGTGLLSSIGGSLGNLGNIGSSVGSVLQIAAWAILIPIVIQLVGALVQLGAILFALPAAAGVAVAAFAPLIIAFQGFGEAVSTGLAGDTEKYNEALKRLAPAARNVVRELVGLNPQLKAIKQSVQDAFFRPLQGFFTELGRSLLPLVGRGLTQVGSSLGFLARAIGDTFTTPENLRTLDALFASTNRTVQTLEPTFVNLTQALLNLVRPALPLIERGATAFRNWAASVEAFTARIASGGRLTGWLDRAAHVLGVIIGLTGTLGRYLLAIFGGEVGDQGTAFMVDFRVKLQELIDFIRSPEGQKGLHNFALLLKGVGEVFLFLVGLAPFVWTTFNSVADGIRLVLRVLEAIGLGAVIAGKAVWGFIKAVGSFFADIGRAVGSFFTDTIPRWWTAIVDFFTTLPERLAQALQDIGATLLNAAVNGTKSFVGAIFEGIGIAIGLFLALPGLIQGALQAIPGLLERLWDDAWAFASRAVHRGADAVVAAVAAVPELLSAAGTAIWHWAEDLWTRVSETTWELVSSGWNRVTGFFASIPGRIRAFGPALLDAARFLGRKIGEGLSNIGDFASDIGRKIVSTIRSGINFVIRSINRGLGDIDALLPTSLPRIPELARGAVIDSPTVALLGEAGREVVIPLTDRRRAQDLAEQSGLLHMLRGAGGQTIVNVVAYLDPSGVLVPITRTVVNDVLDQQGGELSYARAA